MIVLARTMFDTKTYEGDEMNLFSPNCTLNQNAVEGLPRDIFLLLRTVQIIRGLAYTFGIKDYSLANVWASQFLEIADNKNRGVVGNLSYAIDESHQQSTARPAACNL
mmetsp:Transcript_13170/g.18236  ORF Transcript_13170/g.18236 Transcript_13170/m.18236 type:complete len:108 (+) Transcript_13170:1519-1842(+)